MISEIRRSIGHILYERTTSPFFGSLIASWIVINWKIFYVTFILSETALRGLNKIDYIVLNCSNPCNLYLWPLISSFVLITIVPLISNGAFWITHKYRQWRINQKNKIEGNTLVTQEQYVGIQQEIARKDIENKNTLTTRQEEIDRLRTQYQTTEESLQRDQKIKMRFRIVQALYGRRNIKFNDVTDTLNGMISAATGNDIQFAVNNDVLNSANENDPASGYWKELILTFQYLGSYHSLSAVEGDQISITNGSEVNIIPGSPSKWIDEAIAEKQKNPEGQKTI